ncbi:MAG: inositol monophosphatase [Gemmatimonadota bacterium]|nr:inositol monophosphatase [Gemmatimonadota bacterium]
MPDASHLLPTILDLHDRIRTSVVAACEQQSHDVMAEVAHDDEGDTIYAVDKVSEATLIEALTELARTEPLVLIAEGLHPEGMVLPAGARETDCKWRLLVDPIDGTRGLMYQKRPAWILTGVAPNNGAATRLRDIVLAVQTEIPLVKQHLSDQLWAERGKGCEARRFNRLTGTTSPLKLHPSRADTIAHGFASISRFFPGARDVLAAIDDEIALAVGGPPVSGKALCFEDQYISTGGQLFELMAGHDRFIADIRPLLSDILTERGMPRGLCCHPYDLCTVLVAEELGLHITDPAGAPLDTPLDLETDVAWAGYASGRLRERVEPAFRTALHRHGMLPR